MTATQNESKERLKVIYVDDLDKDIGIYHIRYWGKSIKRKRRKTGNSDQLVQAG